ncbi:MAG: branched-chain amino acid ABC transporter permease [Candidatus Bathyarchaeia archaeon]
MIDPTLMDSITYCSLLAVMTFGLNFVRRTTGVWNVAHASLVTVGAYVVFTCVSFWGGSPYIYLPLAFILSAIIAVMEYMLIIEPLRKRKASTTMMLVSTLAFDLMMLSIINIYADYLQYTFNFPSKNFLLRELDFVFLDEPGIFWASLSFLVGFLAVLYVVLNYTKIGVALKACVCNPTLASISGINVKYTNLLSWFISGGLGGVAGGLLPLWVQGKPVLGDSLLAIMFCVSIVGGVEEIYGTVLGGFFVGFTQILGTAALSIFLGPAIIPYKTLLPMVILIFALLFAPSGIAKVNWKKILTFVRFGGASKRKA